MTSLTGATGAANADGMRPESKARAEKKRILLIARSEVKRCREVGTGDGLMRVIDQCSVIKNEGDEVSIDIVQKVGDHQDLYAVMPLVTLFAKSRDWVASTKRSVVCEKRYSTVQRTGTINVPSDAAELTSHFPWAKQLNLQLQ